VRRVVALAALALLAAAPVARAQEPINLTLDQALQLARQHNRSLVVEQARLEQAETQVEQGWSALFPTLAAQGRYSHNYKQVALNFGGKNLLLQPSEQLDGAISVNMPLIVPPAYLALEALKAGARASEYSYKVAETNLLLSVAQTFYLAAIADEVVAARISNIEVARATLQNSKARLEAGSVTKVDVDRAELAVVRAEQAERESRNGRDRTYRALATLIQENRPLKAVIQPVPPEMHDENELDLVLKVRPEYHLLEESTKAAEAQSRARAWQWAPVVSGFGNIRKFNYDNFAFDRHSWVVGAQLDWALYDGGLRDAQRHYANAQAAESRARSAVLRDSIRDDLSDGRRQVETKQRALETAERSVTLATEVLEVVRVQYEAGSITQVDLLAAQDSLVLAREALAQARYDLASADLTLRRTAGTFPPK
jgi:outer membrane protein TolC